MDIIEKIETIENFPYLLEGLNSCEKNILGKYLIDENLNDFYQVYLNQANKDNIIYCIGYCLQKGYVEYILSSLKNFTRDDFITYQMYLSDWKNIYELAKILKEYHYLSDDDCQYLGKKMINYAPGYLTELFLGENFMFDESYPAITPISIELLEYYCQYHGLLNYIDQVFRNYLVGIIHEEQIMYLIKNYRHLLSEVISITELIDSLDPDYPLYLSSVIDHLGILQENRFTLTIEESNHPHSRCLMELYRIKDSIEID